MEQTSARAFPSAHQLAVLYRPVSALKPDARNARTHPKRQIEQLVRSIQEFGFTNPVLIDEGGVLIAGHGRLRAAKELGLAEVPTITLEGLSSSQKKALRLADNRSRSMPDGILRSSSLALRRSARSTLSMTSR